MCYANILIKMEFHAFVVMFLGTEIAQSQIILEKDTCTDRTWKDIQQEIAETQKLLRQYVFEIADIKRKIENIGKDA